MIQACFIFSAILILISRFESVYLKQEEINQTKYQHFYRTEPIFTGKSSFKLKIDDNLEVYVNLQHKNYLLRDNLEISFFTNSTENSKVLIKIPDGIYRRF